MTSLLDANVLLALAWPNHVRHDFSTEWFMDKGERMGALPHHREWLRACLFEPAFHP